MIESESSVFSDLVIIGNIIKINMNNGKLPSAVGTSSGIKKLSSNFHKKKEAETNAIMGTQRKNKARHPLPLPNYEIETIVPTQYQHPAYPTPPAQKPWAPRQK